MKALTIEKDKNRIFENDTYASNELMKFIDNENHCHELKINITKQKFHGKSVLPKQLTFVRSSEKRPSQVNCQFGQYVLSKYLPESSLHILIINFTYFVEHPEDLLVSFDSLITTFSVFNLTIMINQLFLQDN